MIRLGEAIDAYHELLLDEQIAADADGKMRGELRKRGLYFGERPLCTVLRPHFYFTDQWAYLQQETEILLRAFGVAHEACMRDAKLRAQLALEAYEEQLFSLDIGGVVPWTSSRLELVLPDRSEMHCKFVEYNAETPAGMGYGDVLGEPVLRTGADAPLSGAVLRLCHADAEQPARSAAARLSRVGRQ